MATIHSLPREVLSNVARHVTGPKRAETLRNFALVCRDWASIGQEELWRVIQINVLVNRPDVVTKFALSEATRRGLRTVELRILNAWSLEEALLLFRACQGVTRLALGALDQQDEVDFRLLQHESLAGIKELTLYHSLWLSEPEQATTNFTFAFSLTRLSLELGGFANVPRPLVASLLRQPTLTSLDFAITEFFEYDVESTLQMIRSNVAQISTLRVDYLGFLACSMPHDDPLHPQQEMDDFFTAFRNVKILSCGTGELQYLGQIPKALETLKVDLAHYEGLWLAGSEELADFVAARGNLRSLYFNVDTMGSIHDYRRIGSGRIKRVCKEQGVELEFTGRWAGDLRELESAEIEKEIAEGQSGST